MNSHANNSRSLEAEFHQILRKQSNQRYLQRKQWIKTLFELLFDFLTGTQPLSIRQKTNKDGTSQWIVYEYASDTRCVFDNEQDVRVWIEKKHQRQESPKKRHP
ncbi:MAG: hypothetical protein AAFQ63_04665 [Cyanobacteria bacterium J06621_11]